MCVWCKGDGISGVGSGGGVIACVCGSGVLPSTCDVLEMSVVRSVGGVCDMCMCLARGGVDGEGVGMGLRPGSGAVGWCYVCVRCESGLSV